VEIGSYLRGEFPYGQQLPYLVAEGRSQGVTRWIVFPMVSYLAMDLAALRKGEIELGGDLESVPYSFENRRMMEEIYELYPEYADPLFPFIILDPSRKVSEQVKAIQTLRNEYRFHGFKLQSTVIQSPVKQLLTEGLPFLELAEEWDFPLLIHSSVLPIDEWAQAWDILEVAEKNPSLRFCLAHSCRFDRECLDRVAELPNTWFDCSAHRIHCQLATDESAIVAAPEKRFKSDFTNPSQVLLDMAQAYPNKLLWGSDSPAYSFVANYENESYSLKSTYPLEVDCLMALPENLRLKVANGNTLEFLGVAE
jgi:predicted TIM-barrel fold metal-dependent hydrolase